jgi:hypothetical protein
MSSKSSAFFRCGQGVWGKGKGHPRTNHKVPDGEKYSSTFSLSSALDGVVSQRHVSAALTPREKSSTNFIRGWVGARARLDGCRKNCSHRDSITRLSIPLRVAIPTELSRPKTLSGSEFERSHLWITEMRNEWSYSLLPLLHAAHTAKTAHFMYM